MVDLQLEELRGQLQDYQNALRVCREAMQTVLMREKVRPVGAEPYTIIDGGSLQMALDFTAHMATANGSRLGKMQTQVEELQKDATKLAELRKNVLYGPPNGLDKWDREHCAY
jgi:hypothetical protein